MHFTFDNKKIPLQINFREAYKVLPEHGIHILGLLVDDNIVKTLTTILTDDLKLLGLWYYFVKEHESMVDDFEILIEKLTPEEFQNFKDTLWAAIVAFTHPRLRPALIKGREEAERELSKSLKNLKFSNQSLDTVEDQE